MFLLFVFTRDCSILFSMAKVVVFQDIRSGKLSEPRVFHSEIKITEEKNRRCLFIYANRHLRLVNFIFYTFKV